LHLTNCLYKLRVPILATVLSLLLFVRAQAQTQPVSSGQNGYVSANDSAGKKTNTSDWQEENAIIYFTKGTSETRQLPDTSIDRFHRRPFVQSQKWWQYRDLGNLGSPIFNLMFKMDNPVGLSLGYHVYDPYRFDADQLSYYNTTRPYSVFSYQLGSKLEQVAEVMHTQNIKPHWNFAFNYRKINSPGYYFVQRNNHDNLFFNTNYNAPGQHYKIKLAFVYNKEQHDENGGILSDTFLTNSSYNDRKTIPTQFGDATYSSTRSPVSNMQRDFTILLNHQYTWGRMDTTYNADSTKFFTDLTPRFRIGHRLEFTGQKHLYKDMRPDSLDYTAFFQHFFNPGDSVFSQQNWFYIDNRFDINGLLGKRSNQLVFNAGIGNRFDQFKTNYLLGTTTDNIFSNYLTASIGKEARAEGKWDYGADAKTYLTGDAAGNFEVHAALSRTFRNKKGAWGALRLFGDMQLNNAPYSYTVYQNQYWSRFNDFNKESQTRVGGMLDISKYKISIMAVNFLVNNYLYFDAEQAPAQYSSTFNLTQLMLRKKFTLGMVTLDNELTYQQVPDHAPVNVPSWIGRHKLAIETGVFKHLLHIATGLELRYHSNYYAPGYSPFFNRFYYQQSYQVTNNVEASIFFNFTIKRFRAFVMGDQLQQLFTHNIIITQGYAAPNTAIRFGFSWVLIN